MSFSIVLVGAGNMGGAMLKGWVSNGFDTQKITVLDPAPSSEMQDFLTSSKITHSTDTGDISPPDVLLVAVKPQMMATVLPGLKPLISENTVVVSVAAGTTLETLTSHLGDIAAIRVMPNTPSLVLRGMSVGCCNHSVDDIQKTNVHTLMQAVGRMEWVEDEKLIDAVTAVSGSGPAYVFHIAECMAKAGVAAGLCEELALILARETIAGAGALLVQSDDHPSQLRRNVTSPNGTTAAALEILMKDDAMSDLVVKAILAAKRRSEELS